jgi:hypothetical protein
MNNFGEPRLATLFDIVNHKRCPPERNRISVAVGPPPRSASLMQSEDVEFNDAKTLEAL